MTPDELAAIRQRCEAATPPPWNLCEIEKPKRFAFAVQCDAYSDEQPGVCGDFDKHWPLTQDDAEFIAHARQDIPALLAHIASLEADLTACAEALLLVDDYHDDYPLEMPDSALGVLEAVGAALARPGVHDVLEEGDDEP